MKPKTKMSLRIKFTTILYRILPFVTAFIILFVAYLNERLVETLITMLLFYLYRSMYVKQYHAKSLFLCSGISIIVFTIVTLLNLKLSLSICTSILLTFAITAISYRVKDYMDLQFVSTHEVDNRTKIVKILNGEVSEEDIIEYCLENDLSLKIAETTFLYLNNKLEDVAEILDIDNSTVVRRVKQFIKSAR